MKKYGRILIALFLLFPFTVTAKEATFESQDLGNNQIRLGVKLTEGHVTAFDFHFQLTGNIKVIAVDWPENIASTYTRRYYYDEKNNTLDLYVATGNHDNLVDNANFLVLAMLRIAPQGSEDTSYTIEIQKEFPPSIMTENYQTFKLSDMIGQKATFIGKGIEETSDPEFENHPTPTPEPDKNEEPEKEPVTEEEQPTKEPDKKEEKQDTLETTRESYIRLSIPLLWIILAGILVFFGYRKYKKR